MQRLSATDVVPYWMAPIIPNDQFVVYIFADDRPVDAAELAAWIATRAANIADLRLRVLDIPFTLDRPYWVHADILPRQFVVDDAALTWQECLAILADRMAEQLDPTEMAWRVHLFAHVSSVPGTGALGDEVPDAAGPRGGDGRGVVVTLQFSHALGDGRRAAAIARELFGQVAPSPATSAYPIRALPDSALRVAGAVVGAARLPAQFASMIARGFVAWQRYRASPPQQSGGVPLSRLNRAPGAGRTLRTITVEREALRIGDLGVTVGALVAISLALPTFLADPEGSLVVELTVARSPKKAVRNNFRNVGVDLHVDEPDLAQRARLIAAEIDTARRADDDPARVASRAATAATPAALTRWGIGHFDPTLVPENITGVTVVSSVNRGAGDLALDGRPVLATTGFPALSPVQGLTHGVHGIADRVTISVTTSPEIAPDVDDYVTLLSEAIDRLGTLRPHSVKAGRVAPAMDRGRSEENSVGHV